ncbi:hypothetical protein N9764_07665 [Polaribacter sp.]|nr:hypothetical protein [Polaribacter sp.]
MKSKLLPILLILLVVLNCVLIFMLINKPHEKQRQHSERNFLTAQLQFSDTQKEQFLKLDIKHRDAMMAIEEKIKEQKDVLFSSFYKENFNSDSLTNKIGFLEGTKEAELFRFFCKVRKLCTSDQAQKFDEIIINALRGGKGGPPNAGNMPPPPGERVHHPPR